MQPSSLIQSTIECLGQLLDAWHKEERLPADVHFQRYTKMRRYIGSKDRQAIAKRYYHALRHLAILDDLANDAPAYQCALPYPCPTTNGEATARAMIFAALVAFHECTLDAVKAHADGEKFHPAALTKEEVNWLSQVADRFDEDAIDTSTEYWILRNNSQWLREALQDSLGKHVLTELAALQQEAPVDIRVNTLKTTRKALQQKLAEEGIETTLTPTSPIGLRLQKRTPIFNTEVFHEGHFEMQDEGSQIAACLVDAKPGMRVVDFCAGAGGKTLAIAAQMKNKGRILAFDTSARRLKELPLRIRRAGVDNASWRTIDSESDSFLKRHKKTADRVLVDAPCSGTGTWRRNPDLKWRLTERDVNQLMEKQLAILTSAARLVKPGGRLIYVTCSLLKRENEEVVDAFLDENMHFKLVCAQKIWDKESIDVSDPSPTYLYLNPGTDGTDGFFAATLVRDA